MKTYEEELRAYNARIRKLADSIGYKFKPLPPVPKRDTVDFDKSVDVFLDYLTVRLAEYKRVRV